MTSNRISENDAYCQVFHWRLLCTGDVSSGYNCTRAGKKRTVVCDVILPMGQLPTEGVPEVFEGEAHSKPLGYVRDDSIPEECPRF